MSWVQPLMCVAHGNCRLHTSRRSRTPGARVDVPAVGLDLMSQDSVRAFAAEVHGERVAEESGS
jgi:hypothetical protein